MKIEKHQSIENARQLMRKTELGVLSTHSKSQEGYPFGSVSTYMSTHEGDIVFHVSDLAQHTKNFNHNDKMCLTVFPVGRFSKTGKVRDANAGARLSLLGTVKKIDEDQLPWLAERYYRLYPASRSYQSAHDFAFYRMTTERVRFIRGFGDIHWIHSDQWRLNQPDWVPQELSMINHMNEDHEDAMQLIFELYTGIKVENVQMLAINPEGAYYSADSDKPVFISFGSVCNTGVEIRKALVAQTNEARAKLGLTPNKRNHG